jgi:hypothetical protein
VNSGLGGGNLFKEGSNRREISQASAPGRFGV